MTREDALIALRREAFLAALGRGLRREQAEDAASDVVLEVLRLPFRPKRHYAKGLIRNVLSDAVKSACKDREHLCYAREEVLEDLIEDQAGDEDTLIDAILAKEVFEGLPSLHRDTVASLVRHVQPNTHLYGAEELGSELGVTENRARHRVMAARRHMAESLEDPSPTDGSVPTESSAP